MDLTATILHAARLADEAASLDGVNLLPYLRGDKAPEIRQLFWQADFYGFGRQRAIREGNWKFIEHDSTQFLFDLEADISERHNLYYDQPEVVKRLRGSLSTWQDSL